MASMKVLGSITSDNTSLDDPKKHKKKKAKKRKREKLDKQKSKPKSQNCLKDYVDICDPNLFAQWPEIKKKKRKNVSLNEEVPLMQNKNLKLSKKNRKSNHALDTQTVERGVQSGHGEQEELQPILSSIQKDRKRKKRVAFNLSPVLLEPKPVQNPLVVRNIFQTRCSGTDKKMSLNIPVDGRHSKPAMDENGTESQSTSDDINSQDLFITQKSFSDPYTDLCCSTSTEEALEPHCYTETRPEDQSYTASSVRKQSSPEDQSYTASSVRKQSSPEDQYYTASSARKQSSPEDQTYTASSARKRSFPEDQSYTASSARKQSSPEDQSYTASSARKQSSPEDQTYTASSARKQSSPEDQTYTASSARKRSFPEDQSYTASSVRKQSSPEDQTYTASSARKRSFPEDQTYTASSARKRSFPEDQSYTASSVRKQSSPEDQYYTASSVRKQSSPEDQSYTASSARKRSSPEDQSYTASSVRKQSSPEDQSYTASSARKRSSPEDQSYTVSCAEHQSFTKKPSCPAYHPPPPPRKPSHHHKLDASTQTENFFTCPLLATSLRFHHRSTCTEEPMDLSLPKRSRLHQYEVISKASEDQHRSEPSVTDLTHSDDSDSHVKTKADLSHLKVVQTRLNESFFFKLKGEGDSPKPRSPLMKFAGSVEKKKP